LVNAVVAISSTNVRLFSFATMLSSQPSIILCVSIGRALRAFGDQAHSGSEEGHRDGMSLNLVYLCIACSFLTWLGLVCISWRFEEQHILKKSTPDSS
jgi:hypothetical protein